MTRFSELTTADFAKGRLIGKGPAAGKGRGAGEKARQRTRWWMASLTRQLYSDLGTNSEITEERETKPKAFNVAKQTPGLESFSIFHSVTRHFI